MPYEAVKGTLPHRVIEYLRSLGEGAEASTTEIAIALELENARGLRSWLTPAVEGGALAVRVGGARMSFYRIGDGKDLFAREADKTVAHVPASAVSNIFAYAEQRNAAPFSTALSSDGRLILQRHGRVIAELTADEANEHRKFLRIKANDSLHQEIRRLEALLESAGQQRLFESSPTQ